MCLQQLPAFIKSRAGISWSATQIILYYRGFEELLPRERAAAGAIPGDGGSILSALLGLLVASPIAHLVFQLPLLLSVLVHSEA